MKKFLLFLLFPLFGYGQLSISPPPQPPMLVTSVNGGFGQIPPGADYTTLVSLGQNFVWAKSAVIEKDTSFTGVTTANFTVLKDTAKGSIYRVNALLNFVKNTTTYVGYFVSYTNESGVFQSKVALQPTAGGSTVFQGDNGYNPREIWVKPGSVITLYTVSTSTTIPLFDVRGELTRVK